MGHYTPFYSNHFVAFLPNFSSSPWSPKNNSAVVVFSELQELGHAGYSCVSGCLYRCCICYVLLLGVAVALTDLALCSSAVQICLVRVCMDLGSAPVCLCDWVEVGRQPWQHSKELLWEGGCDLC